MEHHIINIISQNQICYIFFAIMRTKVYPLITTPVGTVFALYLHFKFIKIVHYEQNV